MEIAEFLLQFSKVYCLIGLVVAIPFLLIGIDRIEPSARGSYTFRPLLLPGIALIWPIVIYRWYILERSGNDKDEISTT